MVVISLKEANRQRCRPGRRRNARQGHTCASLAPQNRPKGPRLLAPRTTSDIRGEIVPGDGASLVSLFLDSLSLPTSPLATTMVSSLLSVLVVVSPTPVPSCPSPWGNQGGERGLFLVGPGYVVTVVPRTSTARLSSYTPPSHSPLHRSPHATPPARAAHDEKGKSMAPTEPSRALCQAATERCQSSTAPYRE